MAQLDEHIAFSVFRLLIMIVSVLGNLLILFILFSNRKLRKSGPNVLFAQLAAADLILGIGAGARGVSAIYFAHFGITSYHKGLCLILGSPTVLGIHLSQTTMVSIAFDRFLCIRLPVFYRNLENHRFAFLRSVCCILYSILGSAASYIGVSFSDSVEICSTGTAIRSWYSTYWLIFATVLTLVIYVAYIAIYILFLQQTNSSYGKTSSQKAIFVTMSAVLASYFICWCIPNVLFAVFKSVQVSPTLLGYIGVLTGVGSALSSTTNIFIYGWKHPQLKNQLKRLFYGIMGRRLSTVEPMTVPSKS
ncbi:hypothetical protein L596_007681 [Steinernema carpocapsae]|uniref:G-protein coupled receptors family 1 profile domain-containing protein n=1 Tax=Steinernema carpocapsae TaxID=34508 RepID=A0A4U5PA65_STECR|nr:hypothetical protein L596_007681 [Steinernema carpocapsae]